MARVLDNVFCFFLLIHIPFAILFDSQALFPRHLFPQQLVGVTNRYCREFRDPLLLYSPPWFRSFIFCILLLQFPFSFVGAYAFFKGAAKARWIRIPVIVYSTHMATTLVPILFHFLTYDFSQSKHPAGPQTAEERLVLCSVYLMDFVVPLVMLVDACFSSAYRVPVVSMKRKQG